MRFYEQDEMEQVVARTARLIGLDVDEDGVEEIARRSRGTPRRLARESGNLLAAPAPRPAREAGTYSALAL